MSLTRQQILNSAKQRIRKVDTPAWEGEGFVYVKRLDGPQTFQAQEHLEAIAECVKKGDQDKTGLPIAKLVVLAVCDKAGEPLFKPGDAPALAAGPIPPLTACLNAALNLNHMDPVSSRKIKKKSKRVRRSKRG